MSEYLKEINEFWQEYMAQYNSIYDLDTLNKMVKNNDTTAFLHPQDLAYLKKHFGDNFSEIPRFKKMVDYANGKVKINKNRQRVVQENAEISPAIARPYFGNPESADIVILKKQAENDFKINNPNLPVEVVLRYRNRVLSDIQGKLKMNGQKIFLPYLDRHCWFEKYLYSNGSILKQFRINPNRVMVMNFFPYQTGHTAGLPKDFLTFNHYLPSQEMNFELMLKIINDEKPRIYIVSEEELFISIFKNFADSELYQYLVENLFVLSSKQNRHITVCNVLSYKEHITRLRKKETLSKTDYYNWNKQQKIERDQGNSDFIQKLKAIQRPAELLH